MFGNGQILYSPASASFPVGIYVPYTGATNDVDLGSYGLNAKFIKIKGTAGDGRLELRFQSATPSVSANASTVYADENGDLSLKIDSNFVSTFKTSGNTANRTYTFQNGSGTVAFTSDIVATKLSAIVAASATNSIDNLNFAQTWAWSTLTTQTGILLTANALTAGNLLLLTSTSTASTTGSLLNISKTGAATTNIAAIFTASGGTNNYAALFTGFTGFGTSTPLSNIHLVKTSIGVAQNDANGIILGNSTAAANNAQQYSPSIVLQGNGWGTTGSISQDVRGRIFVIPTQGTTPSAQLVFQTSSNGGSSYTTRAWFDSDGNTYLGGGSVLIGTTTPQSNIFYVSAGSTSSVVKITNTSSNGNNFILANTHATGKTYSFVSTASGNDTGGGCFSFYDVDNAATRMFINASGNVGIGLTSTLGARLHVVSITEQLRLGYNLTNYLSTTISSTANATFNLTAASGTPIFTFNQTVAMGATLRLFGYTVATLPAGLTGDRAYVTDANAPTYGAIVAGGGTSIVPVFYNGTNWITI